jgi:glycosyltransferase involved in cell wall biosynthesis
MELSVLVATRNRPEVVNRCVSSVFEQTRLPDEVLVFDDGDVPADLSEFDDDQLEVIRRDEPHGVSGARNELMTRASGDVLVMIDDDAYFSANDALERVERQFDDEDLGILAFDVHHHAEGEPDRLIPFSRSALMSYPDLRDQPRRVSYFLGTAHAIRSDVIDETNGYDDNMTYAGEELDLSLNSLKLGYEIRYDPEVEVHHEPEPPVVSETGKHELSELYFTTRSRIILVYRHYPWRYGVVNLLIWLFRLLVRSLKQGVPRDFFRGIVDGVSILSETHREPFGQSTLRYMRENYGRVWY